MISLKTKITLAVSVLVALLMSLGAYSGLFYFERQFKEFTFGQQYAMVSAMADEVDGKIATFQAELTTVATKITPEILNSRPAAQRFIDDRDDTRHMFDNGFYIFLPSGKILAGVPNDLQMRTTDFSFREYFKKTIETKKPYISEPYISMKRHHHPAVMLTAPVLDARGNVVAFLGGSIDLMKDNFLGKLATAKIGKSGYFYLFNSERKLLVHPNRGRILKDTVKPGANRLFDRALEGFEGTGETVTSWGAPMVSSFKRLKTTGWVLAASTPQAEAYAPITRVKEFMLFAVPIVTLLSVGTVWIVMNLLTAPLLRFTAHVRSVAGGDGERHKPAEITSRDEIGDLAKAFNQMLSDLDAREKTVQESEARLKSAVAKSEALIAAIGDGLTVQDRDFRVVYQNQVIKDLCGEHVGEYCYRVYEQEDDVCPGCPVAACFADGEIHTSERCITVDGKQVFVENVASPIRDAAGEITAAIELCRDITGRRLAEKALRETEELFHQLFFQNWDAIVLLARETYRVIAANPVAVDLFGYSREELAHLDLSAFMAPDDTRRFIDTVPPSPGTGGVQLDNATMIRKDGSKASVSVRYKLIRLRDNDVVYCSFRDISEKIRQEREMKETQAKLIHANRMTSLGMLVSGIAHEINNPNCFISGNASILSEVWQDAAPILSSHFEERGDFNLAGLPFSDMQARIPRLIGGLKEGSRRINDIVNGLKDFARDDSSTPPSTFDANKAIQDAASILSHQVHRYTYSFTLDLADNLPPARGKAQQIEQVVINLIMNSLQALPCKTRGVHVATAFEERSGWIVITVKDEGKGMEREVMERITEPFFSTRLSEGGTGLGLSISASIIKEHDGFLEFASAPELGTITTVRLPAAVGAAG